VSCLVGCAQGSVGTLSGRGLDDPAGRCPERIAFLRAPYRAEVQTGVHRELPCWLRPRQRRGAFGSSWMILQAVARIGSRSEKRRTEPSSDGSSSRAALLAAPKAAFEARQIETWTKNYLDVSFGEAERACRIVATGHFTDGRGRTKFDEGTGS
jgi:hypothetical protein